MSKRAFWLAIILAFGLVAAACGDDDGGDDGTGTTAEGETTTSGEAAGSVDLAGVDLQLMGWSSSPAEDEALSGLVGEFNQATGANASFNPVPEYDATLQAALAGGDPPDVFYVDSNRLPDLVDAAVLQPVPEGAIEDPDDVFPTLREAFTLDGTWYCPPKDFSTLALVYDVDALEEAGVAVPTTWEELRSSAEALTTGDRAGLTMGVEYPRWGVFLFQAGGGLTNEEVTEMTLDTAESREALEFVSGLYQSGAAVNPADVDAGWAGEAFGQGKAAMTIEGNWIVSFLNETFPERNAGYAELPTGPAGPGTFAFTVCYGVPVNATNPEASWALVDYLTGPEGSLSWTNAFNVMPARESVSDEWLGNHEDLEAFVSGAEYANKFQFRPGFNDVLGVFSDQAQGLVAGSATVDQLIEEVTAAGEGVLP